VIRVTELNVCEWTLAHNGLKEVVVLQNPIQINDLRGQKNYCAIGLEALNKYNKDLS